MSYTRVCLSPHEKKQQVHVLTMNAIFPQYEYGDISSHTLAPSAVFVIWVVFESLYLCQQVSLAPKVSKGSDLFYCLLYKTVSTHLQLRRRKLLLEYSNLIYFWQTAEIWTDVVHTRLYSVQFLPVLQWALQTIVSSFSHCFPPAGTSGPGICALLFCISKGKEWTKSTHLPLASSGGSLHYVSHCRLDWAG